MSGERTAQTPGDVALAADLYGRAGALHSIARRHSMTVEELAAWASEPANARALERIGALADVRAGLVVRRAREDAARLLRRLARSAESEETRRKACVDLLKIEADPRAPRHESARGAPDDDMGEPPDADAIRDLLETLGSRGRDDA